MITFNYYLDNKQHQYHCSKYYDFDRGWFLNAEVNTRNFVQNFVKPNFTIIDAGAQIGLEQNNCENVEVLKVPLSDKVETKSDKIFKIWSKQIIDEQEYNFETIDNFVSSRNITVDLLKIDVDSYDYEVLLGSEQTLRNQSPYVIVELNHALGKRGFNKEQGIEFLQSLGYKLQHHYDDDNFLFSK